MLFIITMFMLPRRRMQASRSIRSRITISTFRRHLNFLSLSLFEPTPHIIPYSRPHFKGELFLSPSHPLPTCGRQRGSRGRWRVQIIRCGRSAASSVSPSSRLKTLSGGRLSSAKRNSATSISVSARAKSLLPICCSRA